MEIITQMRQWLNDECGVDFIPEIGISHFSNFESNGIKGWYATDIIKLKSKEDLYILTVGYWNRPLDKKVFKSKTDLGDEEAKVAEKLSRQMKDRLEALGERRIEMSQTLASQYSSMVSLLETHSSKYLTEKGFSDHIPTIIKVSDAKLIMNPTSSRMTNLYIPMRDTDGVLWNTQLIISGGQKSLKRFIAGARVKGLYHTIGGYSSTMFLCEGYATGISIYLATGTPVIVAFLANNLVDVALAFRKAHPEVVLINCADEDKWKSTNTGRQVAEVLKAKCNIDSVYPIFSKDHESLPTDYNDLHVLEGLDTVSSQLKPLIGKPLASKEVVQSDSHQSEDRDEEADKEVRERGLSVVLPMSVVSDTKIVVSESLRTYTLPLLFEHQWLAVQANFNPLTQKASLPSETEMSKFLADQFKHSLIRWERDLFYWGGTHWVYLDGNLTDKFMHLVMGLIPQGLTVNKLRALIGAIKDLIPSAIRHPFVPDCERVSFLDGNVHLYYDRPSNAYHIRYTGHNPRDLCTYTLPFNRPPLDQLRKMLTLGDTTPTPHLDTLLARLFPEEPNHHRPTISEMFGSALFPIFTKIFLLYGFGSTGKSTLAKILLSLMDKKNVASLPPEEMQGFNLEALEGKTVNICTEIGTSALPDRIIKSIYDRSPVTINRKFKQAIRTPLPNIHIFCGNHVFKSSEENSGAYERRLILLNLKNVIHKEDLNFVDNFVDNYREELILFAFEGIIRLLKSKGVFTVPQESIDAVKEFSNENPVSFFIEEVGAGDWKIEGAVIRDEGIRVERKLIWEAFRDWAQDANVGTKMGKVAFYKRLRTIPKVWEIKSGDLRYVDIITRK